MIGDKFLQLGFREKDLLPEPDIAYFMFLVSKPAFRAAENFAGFFQGVKLSHDSPMSFLIRYMVCLWGFFIFPFMNFQTVRGWRFNKIDTFSTDKSLSPMKAINFSLNSSIVLFMYILNISKVQVKYFFNIFLYFFEKGIYNVRGGFN